MASLGCIDFGYAARLAGIEPAGSRIVAARRSRYLVRPRLGRGELDVITDAEQYGFGVPRFSITRNRRSSSMRRRRLQKWRRPQGRTLQDIGDRGSLRRIRGLFTGVGPFTKRAIW